MVVSCTSTFLYLSILSLRYNHSLRSFHFYLWNIRNHIIRSVHALRLYTSDRPFHFDSTFHIDLFTSTFLSLGFIHFDPRFHFDICTSTLSKFVLSLSHRLIHFDIKVYGSKYLALRSKKYFTLTQHLR